MSVRQPSIAWIGLDVPVEILAAAGSPFRLDAEAASSAGAADAFGEGGGHPWMRAVTARLIELAPSLSRVVIGATPVTGVWLHNFLLTLRRGKNAPALPVSELVNLFHGERASARAFNRASFARLAQALGVGSDRVEAAILERNAVRAEQRRIEVLRYGPARRLTGAQARRLLDAADQMPAQAYLVMASEALGAAPPGELRDHLPVVYSGPGSPSVALYEALEARGLTVVADDADYGTRAIGQDVDPSGDPIDALARRYAGRSPAPAGWSTRRRVEWLTSLAVERGARAVIFDMPPWAHPAAWDYPAHRQALEAVGVACVLAPDAPAPDQADAVVAAMEALGLMDDSYV